MYLFDRPGAIAPATMGVQVPDSGAPALGDYLEGMGDYLEGCRPGSDCCDDCAQMGAYSSGLLEDEDSNYSDSAQLGTWWQDLIQAGTSVVQRITQPRTTFPVYTPPYTEPGDYPAPSPEPYQQTTGVPSWLPWAIGGGAALYLLTRR